jgi:rod shape-determining protein MreC
MTGRSDSFILFKRLKKRKVVSAVLFYCVLIAIFHTETGSNFSDKSRFFLSSIKASISKCSDIAERVFYNLFYFLSSHDVENKLFNLNCSNELLREEIENLKHLQNENEELKKLLLLKKSEPFSVKTARIIDIFSNDFTQSIVLNIGKSDGVSPGDIVKNSDGLIGRITEAYDTHSNVLLITDMNSCIPVKIGKTPVNAIMVGGNSNKLFISTVHEDIPINDGDEVRTSGYGIREDIYIGKILKNGQKNTVKSNINFNSLKYAVVLSNP